MKYRASLSLCFCDSLPCGLSVLGTLPKFCVVRKCEIQGVTLAIFLAVCLVGSVSRELYLNSVWSEGMKYRASLSSISLTVFGECVVKHSAFEPNIDRKSSQMGPWGGNPGERSWRHFGSQGRPGEQTGDNLGSLAHLGVPKGLPLGTLFLNVFVIWGVYMSSFF